MPSINDHFPKILCTTIANHSCVPTMFALPMASAPTLNLLARAPDLPVRAPSAHTVTIEFRS